MAEEPRPFSASSREDEDKKRQHSARQLVLAYKRCFATDSGKRVLEDLKHKFGFDRWECDNTSDPDEIARRCAAKGPLFHIKRQMETEFRDGKPKRK